jgi:two-component system, sensor histidine kinase and response regulator
MKIGLRGRILCATAAALLCVLLAAATAAWFVVPAHERAELLGYILGVGAPTVACMLAVLAVALRRWVFRPLTSLKEGQDSLALALAQRERELLAARQASDEGVLAKTQFLAAMSHELRTPLNAVMGLTELLQGTQLDARQQRFTALIRQSAHSLAGVIDDVLDCKHIDAGALRLVDAPFRLRDAVFGTVERYRDSAERRGLSLAVHFDSALPDVVRGDLLHVTQVLGNLLSNAVKFTERGGVIVRVTPSDLGLRFSVTDTGMGISSEVMPHIYDVFHQGDGSSTRRFGGTGLGLSIARQLCAAMGGRIDASSRPGKGSTFWFDLPLPAVPDGLPDADSMPMLPGHSGPQVPGMLGV